MHGRARACTGRARGVHGRARAQAPLLSPEGRIYRNFLRVESLRALLPSFEGEGEHRIMDLPKQGFDGVIFAACLSASERVCFT